MADEPTAPLDLYAPGALAALFARNRALYGDSTMEAGGQDDVTPERQPDHTDPPAETPSEPKGEAPRFTQADLDRYVSEARRTERAKYEKAVEDEKAKAGKSAAERAEMERDQALAKAGEVTAAAATRIASAEAKVAAQAAGARQDRLAAILKQADLAPAIGEDGEVDEAKVKAAVEAVLTEYPEWKAAPGTGAGRSGGEHTGGGDSKPRFTRAEIDRMGAAGELVGEKLAAVNEALADGRVSG